MTASIKAAARLSVLAAAIALALPGMALAAPGTGLSAASYRAAMTDMVSLTSTSTSYHMGMDGEDLEVFEGVYTNDHPEPVEDIMLRVRMYSHPGDMLMDQFYVSAANDYILGSGDTGTYKLELPMSDTVMWEVDGPYAVHGLSVKKALRAVVDSTSVDTQGVRHYYGTVTNDSAVGVALTDIIVSAEERVGGSFFGVASDEELFASGKVLASSESTSFELIGMQDNPAGPPVLANVQAQGRYLTMIDLSASTSAPSYGASVKLSSMLDAVAPAAMLTSQTVDFAGASLKSGIAPFASSVMWNGMAYATSARPSWATRYQAIFQGDSNYGFAESPQVLVKPKPYLSTPSSASTQYYGRYYTTAGYLKPRHTAGTKPVRIYRERYVSGRWKPYGYVSAKASNYSSYSKYSVSMKLPARGRWRLKATHVTDTYFTGTSTSWRYVTVR